MFFRAKATTWLRAAGSSVSHLGTLGLLMPRGLQVRRLIFEVAIVLYAPLTFHMCLVTE